MLENQEAMEKRKSLQVSESDQKSALSRIRPMALKEGYATVPNVTFDDIGALGSIRSSQKDLTIQRTILLIIFSNRQELYQEISLPIEHPEKAAAYGLDQPSGVLLCGPPGCGKTLLAKAAANQAGINFISVKGPELVNKVV